MIVYFLDRSMNIITMGTTNLPDGIHIIDDVKKDEIEYGAKTLEFDVEYDKNTRKTVEDAVKSGNYILKKYKNEYEYFTIISTENETDGINGSVRVYAEDGGLDLLNEVLLPFGTNESQSLEYYVNKIIYDSGFEIGINEITDTKIALAWDSEDTAQARLLSLCNAFECEMKYSFEVEGLKIIHKYINFYKKIGIDENISLRLGKEINSITIKSTVENLTTCLRVTGGTPEGEENPITLVGYTYDDGDIYVDADGSLKSRYGLSKWSRYLSETGNDVGHIVSTFSYDTTNVDELFIQAYTQLLSLSDEQINYEVDILEIPETVSLGDVINIIDENGELYLSSRILKLETSEYNDTITATLGDFLIKESDESDEIKMLAQQFKELANSRSFYTWIAYADKIDGTGISLNSNNKKYIGTAYNKTSRAVDISDPSVFIWTLARPLENFRSYISSSDGNVLKAGKTSTIITANVVYDNRDVTTDYTIKWYKDGDLLGNTRSLTVNISDITNETSVYTFEALDDDGMIVTNNEITISMLVDGETVTITSTITEYQKSDQSLNPPSGTWSNTVVETMPGEYLWMKTSTYYSDGTEQVWYSVSRNGQNGEKGDKGDPGEKGESGNDGKGVEKVETEYYVSKSKTSQTGGEWSTDMPVWDVNKYLWIRYKITYVNPDSIEYTTPFNDATWEVINRLNVSEVNLIDGTSNEPITIGTFPDTGYKEGKIYYTNCVLTDSEYVLSFDAKSTVIDDAIACYLTRDKENNVIRVDTSTGYVNTTNDIGLGYAKIKLTDQWTRYWIKYTKRTGKDTQTKRVVIGRLYSGGGTGEVQIRGVKLTRGNKTTGDWSASPSDLEKIINSPTEPENKNVIWCNTSSVPYRIYKYDKKNSKWELINDYNKDLNSLKENITTEYNTSMDQLKESINTTVERITKITSDNGTAIESLKTQSEINASGVGVVTSKIEEIVDEITGLATKQEIQEWARYENGILTLGSSDSPFSVKLSKTELGFYENDTKIAYLSNQQLHISQAIILDKINLGDFTISVDTDKGFMIN